RSLRLTLFPYTTLFRSSAARNLEARSPLTLASSVSRSFRSAHAFSRRFIPFAPQSESNAKTPRTPKALRVKCGTTHFRTAAIVRSEEHTSELQSRGHLV